jgi:enoyl-CoA hydratase/carnithine racemase
MYDGLARLLNEAAMDDRVVITALTGAGDFYSSGNDISNAAELHVDGDVCNTVKERCNQIRYG